MGLKMKVKGESKLNDSPNMHSNKIMPNKVCICISFRMKNWNTHVASVSPRRLLFHTVSADFQGYFTSYVILLFAVTTVTHKLIKILNSKSYGVSTKNVWLECSKVPKVNDPLKVVTLQK